MYRKTERDRQTGRDREGQRQKQTHIERQTQRETKQKPSEPERQNLERQNFWQQVKQIKLYLDRTEEYKREHLIALDSQQRGSECPRLRVAAPHFE